MNRDHEPMCTGCGIDSPLINTSQYGWICNECHQEFETIDRTYDLEDHERRKRERIAEQNEY
uniref:hypothetical protein n=1 Tax=Ningiella ruwaisensis TaxID=2364274 RepID=UPI00109F986B|nr:hypothetical protein [Ningiella ruwaisensis]